MQFSLKYAPHERLYFQLHTGAHVLTWEFFLSADRQAEPGRRPRQHPVPARAVCAALQHCRHRLRLSRRLQVDTSADCGTREIFAINLLITLSAFPFGTCWGLAHVTLNPLNCLAIDTEDQK